MKDLLTGNLLVASSLVTDPIYASGVCLVVHQDDGQVMGVMLNRPLKPSPEALLALLNQSPTSAPANRLAEDESPADQNPTAASSPLGVLHFGGPLSGPVVAIHQQSQLGEVETATGIYVAAERQHLENLVRNQQHGPYRLIVGHLGWEVDQLQGEINAGIWHVVPATAEVVFAGAAEMWPNLIRRATSHSLARWMGVPDVIGAAELN